MKQPIAGVAPSDTAEVTMMTVWPSISVYSSGRSLGRLYAITWPNIYIFRLGNLLALLSIPHALFLYFCRVAPVIGVRYTITNRRIVIQRGLSAVDERAVDLDEFDEIQIVVQSGQAWYDSGDLVFLQGGQEAFRLAAVSRPEAFRHVCWKAHRSRTTVRQSRQHLVASA